jgi:hypothetical protein
LRIVEKVKSYLPGKMDEIGKIIKHFGRMIDNFTGLLPKSTLKDKISNIRVMLISRIYNHQIKLDMELKTLHKYTYLFSFIFTSK